MNPYLSAGFEIAAVVDDDLKREHDIPLTLPLDELVLVLATNEPGEAIYLEILDRAERSASVRPEVGGIDYWDVLEATRSWGWILCNKPKARCHMLGLTSAPTPTH